MREIVLMKRITSCIAPDSVFPVFQTSIYIKPIDITPSPLHDTRCFDEPSDETCKDHWISDGAEG
jgi:hypothetical protein